MADPADPLVELKLGFPWPISKSPGWGAQQMTVQAVVNMINSREDVLPGTHITLEKRDSWPSGVTGPWTVSQGEAIAAAYEISKAGVFAVVGDAASETTTYGALVTTGFNIPQCVPAVGAVELSNKQKYPHVSPSPLRGTVRCLTCIRTLQVLISYDSIYLLCGTENHELRRALQLDQNRFSLQVKISPGTEYGSSYIRPITDGARANNIKILLNQEFYVGLGEPQDYQQPVRNLAESGARVFVVMGKGSEITPLYVEGMMGIKLISAFMMLTEQERSWLNEDVIVDSFGDEAEQVLRDMAAFYIWVESYDDDPQPFLDLENACADATLAAEYPNYTVNQCLIDLTVADCVWALAWGMDQYLKENNLPASALVSPNYRSLPPVVISIFNSSHPAITGPSYTFDVNGDYTFERDSMWVQRHETAEEYDKGVENDIKVAIIDENMIVHDTGNKAVFFAGREDIPPDFAPSIAQNVEWNSALGGVFASLAVLFIVLGLVATAMIVFYRNEGVIKKASWKSLTLIALGTSIASISPLLYIGTPNKAMCVLQPIVLNVGFGLTFSNLLAKTWRVYKIFFNTKMMIAPINDVKLFYFSAGIVVIELIISIVWVTYDAPSVSIIKMTEVKHMLMCQSSDASFQKRMTAVSMAFNGVLLALTTYLSYQTRDVRAEYNESKWIGVSTYNMVAVSALFLPLVYNQDFIGYAFVLRSLGVILAVAVFQICIFGIKFMQLSKPAKEAQPFSQPAVLATANLGDWKVVPSNVESHELRRINKVPVLETASGRLMTLSFSFFARWKSANVIIFPDYLCLEFIVADGQPARFKSFRTAGAYVNIRESGGSKNAEANDLTNMTVITKDGTLDLMLPPVVAGDLQKWITPHRASHIPSSPASPHRPSLLGSAPASTR
ncbi:hypothetical protein HDU85_000001 [Gaertneriomyces sp. JEL0708]|nr:hypothetical protein HDU85_000001 [Gaertneriomyces sp. JEL0708]